MVAAAAPPAEDKAELTLRAHTLRVAIEPGFSADAPFVVHPLRTGQSLPAGATEAMLVLTGASDFDRSPYDRFALLSATWGNWKQRIATLCRHHTATALRWLQSRRS